MDEELAKHIAAFWAAADDTRPEEMKAELHAILSLLPEDNPDRLFEWASLHDFLDDEAGAVSYYQQALDAGLEGDQRAQALVQLGSTLRNLGRIDEAIVLLRSCGNEPSTGSAAKAFLALALRDAGRHDEALLTALDALIPTLPRYQRALRFYCQEIAPSTLEE